MKLSMVKNQHKPISQTIEHKLKNYSRLSQTILLKPLKNPKNLLPLGVAFLSGAQAGEAAIVYSGVRNVAVNIPANFSQVFINLNGAGGNDFEIQNSMIGGVAFIRANEVGGADFAINGFIGISAGGYGYPNANNAGFVIGAGGPWVFGAGDQNTLADNAANENQYPNTKWETNGMTNFIGFRGVLGGATRYGWIRLTRANHTTWTIVDWAYENTGAAITTGSTTLPVELVSFKAVLENKTTLLSWKTATETDNAGYDIERSTDGKKFQSIGWVEGKGTTQVAQNYTYQDATMTEGKTYYYRLRQVDFSGKFEFSQVVSVTHGTKGINVGDFYPNPSTKGRVTLDFNAEREAEWIVTVYDASGKVMHTEQRRVLEGINTLAFNFTRLNKGMYFVKLTNGTEQIYRKLIVN
jgi:hypothetical protein